MSTASLLLQSWSWNPVALGGTAVAALAYGAVFRSAARWGRFAAAVAVLLFTLLSPLNTLADGVLFSAHTAQHLLLLLVVPALLLASLPRGFGLPPGHTSVRRLLPLLGWAGGVGSMWFWHVPEFCDAATTNATVHATQTLSLLALGTAFWWPILAPLARDRLAPGHGIIYLFTACLACTALGIVLTFGPVQACPIFRSPTPAASAWTALRASVTSDRDQQIGGLLMWVPMCLVYVSAILLELFRWHGGRQPAIAAQEVHP